MLYLGPYGGFLLFAAFDLPAGTIVCVFTLRGPSVDFVTNPFPLGIEKNGVFPFFGAQVSTVPICHSFLRAEPVGSVYSAGDVCVY